MNKKEKLLIIDGNALVHRCFHALPPLTTSKGKLVNSVYGFTTSLIKSLNEIKPTHVAVTFDLAGPTFRHRAYSEYKATRVKQPDELYEQIPLVKEVAKAFNIPVYEKQGFEADDVIGTIIHKTLKENNGIQVAILTGDFDTLQLVGERVKVHALKRGVNETLIYDEHQVYEKYGLKPWQIIDLKALAGDSSDNIPGVRGIGQKTAIELLKTGGNLESLLKEIGKNGEKAKKIRPRIVELIKEFKQNALLSKKLATISLDVPINYQLKETEKKPLNEKMAVKLLQELEFKSLLAKIPGLMDFQQKTLFDPAGRTDDSREKNKNYRLLDNPKKISSFISKLEKIPVFAFDTEGTGLNPLDSVLIGISFSWKEDEAYYLWMKALDKKNFNELKKIFADKRILKVAHNFKFDLEMMGTAGFKIGGVYFDTMVASYLLNPGTRGHSLDNLSFVEFGHRMIPIESLIGKGKEQVSMEKAPLEKVSDYSCEDADYTFRLYQKYQKTLKQKNLYHLLEKIEMPLIEVLALMEANGMKIDVKFLNQLSQQYSRERKRLEQNIYELAGKSFNINSPLQLKDVLFVKLKIPAGNIKRTKTGLSTSASELNKMKNLHPIIRLISEYRELSKLISTYLDALPSLVNKKTGRVHTSFNQTITATGRLSSSNPNFQNIPIRTKIGREIRKAFVAEKGYKILAADYSQIELRVVASLAQDQKMIGIFRQGKDIHQATAAEIFGIPLEKVSKEERRRAKEVNFGVLYGMGAYGLADRTGISREEARAFIEKYFATFSEVKKYTQTVLEHARKKSCVETLFGRIRQLSDINSGVAQIRSAAERMAVNMPIQGTAADLMKMAMIEIYKELPKISKSTKIVLQVHDELVLEVPENEVAKVAKFIKKTMEGVYRLRVPIVAEVEAGENWGELKKFEN